MGKRVLVVDDDPRFRRSLCHWLVDRGHVVEACESVADAQARLSEFGPEVVLLDFVLSDGNAHQILDGIERLSIRPTIIIISGEADSEQAFALATRGVREFLAKPLSPERLADVLDRPAEDEPTLAAHARATVGQLGIHDAEALVRRTMVEEALDRTDGSRRSAARLLSISRQTLQHILRRLAD